MRRALVDGRLLARLDQQVFVSRVTIQIDAGGTLSSAGEPLPGWGNVAGLTGIPATIAPSSAMEHRGAQNVVTTTTHVALLSSYFPQITTAMRALVDGAAYDITAVEADSRQAMTRLQLKVVTT